MILESDIERKFHERLTDYGFKVLKLTTPGTIGVMDRMILRPRYSPGPPMFVEFKRPHKKNLRPLQKAIAEDWKKRGCIVLKHISSMGDMDQLCNELVNMVMPDYVFAHEDDI